MLIAFEANYPIIVIIYTVYHLLLFFPNFLSLNGNAQNLYSIIISIVLFSCLVIGILIVVIWKYVLKSKNELLIPIVFIISYLLLSYIDCATVIYCYVKEYVSNNFNADLMLILATINAVIMPIRVRQTRSFLFPKEDGEIKPRACKIFVDVITWTYRIIAAISVLFVIFRLIYLR